MKATGVVRRIDELGRIVLPKELRKNLRIREGENIEIYMYENSNIILKKFSSLKNINEVADYVTNSINKVTKLNTMIIDSDSVVSYSGNNKKEYVNKYISKYLQNILNEGKNINSENQKEMTELISNKEDDMYKVISLIKQNGDIYGALIIFSLDEEITKENVQIIDTFSSFLANYIE